MRCPRGRFPEQTPSTNELCGPRRGFVPGTNKRPRVSTVKNTHSSPPAIARAQRPSISHTKCNPTCARAMGQDYPTTRPSPGANRPIYPSFPALASRSLPEVRIPKAMKVFFICIYTHIHTEYRNADCRLQHIHEHDVTSSLKGKREKTF